jgi:G:T-mismatch repair DNA endonuclease (very short patch repair protein)
MMIIRCESCGKDFKIKKCESGRRKTCSRECHSTKRKKRIECKCGSCGETLYKTESQIKKSTSGLVFCNNKCVTKYNVINQTQNIYKECIMCGKEFKIIESRHDISITCSNKCQGKWQSKYRTGEMASNFRGGGIELICLNCGEAFMTDTPSQGESRKFCGIDCKRTFWSENTIRTEEFAKLKYDGIVKFREQLQTETLPEKLVREWLENNNIEFKQEQGFFRKYISDFYLKEHRAVIEVYGDFWHGNPEVYGYSENLKIPYKNQIERKILDEIKEKDFLKYGFKYFVIWEKDIYKDLESQMQEVFNVLNSPQRLHAKHLTSN